MQDSFRGGDRALSLVYWRLKGTGYRAQCLEHIYNCGLWFASLGVAFSIRIIDLDVWA